MYIRIRFPEIPCTLIAADTSDQNGLPSQRDKAVKQHLQKRTIVGPAHSPRYQGRGERHAIGGTLTAEEDLQSPLPAITEAQGGRFAPSPQAPVGGQQR